MFMMELYRINKFGLVKFKVLNECVNRSDECDLLIIHLIFHKKESINSGTKMTSYTIHASSLPHEILNSGYF